MPIGFDPWYFLFIAPGALLAMWAQARVSSAFHRASQFRTGVSGAEAAARLMEARAYFTPEVAARMASMFAPTSVPSSAAPR